LVPLLAHCGDTEANDPAKSSAAACKDLEMADCEAEPECRLDYGAKLNLEMRCVEEPTPLSCLGPIATCDSSFTITQNASGELFRFAEWCGPSDLVVVDVQRIDNPLHSPLFDEEPNVWSWLACSPSACRTDADCADGEYCNGEGPCDSPGICQEIVSLPCPLPLNEVCGCDGVTYQSECVANSAGARIAFEGGCP
jgi:hypothetical protein